MLFEKDCFMIKYLKSSLSQYLYQKKLEKEKHIIFGKKVKVDKCSVFEGHSSFYDRVIITNSQVGYGTYIGHDVELNNIKIGRYTSIAPNVEFIAGEHPTEKFVSIHPAFYSIVKQAGFTYVDQQMFEEFRYANDTFFSILGNDVWIGQGASIMEGVTIGDGAVIAAKAVVTHDVPPYAIWGGVPARHIRYRFNEEQIQWLLNFKWWEKEDVWIRKHIMSFSDIKNFIAGYKHEREVEKL